MDLQNPVCSISDQNQMLYRPLEPLFTEHGCVLVNNFILSSINKGAFNCPLFLVARFTENHQIRYRISV